MTTAIEAKREPRKSEALAKSDQRLVAVEKLFRSDYVKQQIELALPKHAGVAIDSFLRIALTSIQKNEQLKFCSIESLLSGAMEAAQLGLVLDGVLGHGHLVPFFNKKKGVSEAKFIPGYRGYIDLAYRGGTVSGISLEIVRKGDEFSYSKGTDRWLKHVPNDGLDEDDQELWLGAYCAIAMKDGYRDFEYLTRAKIEKLRKRSKGTFDDKGNLIPTCIWATDTEWMWKKSTMRQMGKRLKLSPEDMGLRRAAMLEEYAEAGVPTERPAITIPASLLPEPEKEPKPTGAVIMDDQRPTLEEGPQGVAEAGEGGEVASQGQQTASAGRLEQAGGDWGRELPPPEAETKSDFTIRCTFNKDRKTALISGHTDFVAERMKHKYGSLYDKELKGYPLVASFVPGLKEFCDEKGIQWVEE